MSPRSKNSGIYLPFFCFRVLILISFFFTIKLIVFQFSVVDDRPRRRLRHRNTLTSCLFDLANREHFLLHHLILSYHRPFSMSFMSLSIWAEPQLSSCPVLEVWNTFGSTLASNSQSKVARGRSQARPLCSTTSTYHGVVQEAVSSDRGRPSVLSDSHCNVCKNSWLCRS